MYDVNFCSIMLDYNYIMVVYLAELKVKRNESNLLGLKYVLVCSTGQGMINCNSFKVVEATMITGAPGKLYGFHGQTCPKLGLLQNLQMSQL